MFDTGGINGSEINLHEVHGGPFLLFVGGEEEIEFSDDLPAVRLVPITGNDHIMFDDDVTAARLVMPFDQTDAIALVGGPSPVVRLFLDQVDDIELTSRATLVAVRLRSNVRRMILHPEPRRIIVTAPDLRRPAG